MNTKWTHWIKASIFKYFDTNRSGLVMYTEPNYRNLARETQYLEVRLDGPDFECVSAGSYTAEVEINCLVDTTQSDASLYKHEDGVGIVQGCFVPSIDVYTYGEAEVEHVACLRLSSKIITDNFGQIAVGIKRQQSAVYATYEIELED